MYSGKKRNSPGNKRNEFREKNSENSIFLEKLLAFFQVLRIEKTLVRMKHIAPITISEEIIDHVAQESSDNRSDEYGPYMKLTDTYKDTRWDEYEFPIPEK